MGLWSRLFGARKRSDEAGWGLLSSHSSSGVDVSQGTALTATTVLAAVTMLCEDFAKLDPTIYRRHADGSRSIATDHDLYDLLYTPNDYQNYFEWAEMMQLSLVLRGNAYSVKIRNRSGRVVKLIPVNADWVALWEAPTGEIFYRVTPNGLHMRAELAGQPFLIPSDDILHVKGFSLNGLLGASRIALAKEAIGLTLGYERQAAGYMAQGAAASGVLTTDKTLTDAGVERMKADWKASKTGVPNAGKVMILEQGLKYQPVTLSAVDAQFIAARNLQIQEVTRIFRIPAHMLGDLQRGNSAGIEQLSQEYINLTITGYTSRWGARLSRDWRLKRAGLVLEFDVGVLSRANITARYNNYARGVSGGFLTPNECRIDDKRDPLPNGDKLLQPSNLAAAGSHATGGGADGGGRPETDSADASVNAPTTA